MLKEYKECGFDTDLFKNVVLVKLTMDAFNINNQSVVISKYCLVKHINKREICLLSETGEEVILTPSDFNHPIVKYQIEIIYSK